MADDRDARYQRLLARQLEMNQQTWPVLQSHGVTETTELRLDFHYSAPDRASAEALKTVLAEETDYDVRVESEGGLFSKRWSVGGTTQPTAISAEILDQWVDWMVTAGVHQNCEIGGRGAEV